MVLCSKGKFIRSSLASYIPVGVESSVSIYADIIDHIPKTFGFVGVEPCLFQEHEKDWARTKCNGLTPVTQIRSGNDWPGSV